MSGRTIEARFLAAAERWPDATAIVSGEKQVSYDALLIQSVQVAKLLSERGAGPGHRVVVSLEKGPEAIAALLGVLIAGATYVPIDANSPILHVQHVLADTMPTAIIFSSSTWIPHLQQASDTLIYSGTTPVDNKPLVSWPLSENGAESVQPRRSQRESDHAAYILYTSGSTGIPKGVAISSMACLNFVDWARQHLGVKRDDRLASHASFSFDLSVFDLFATLLSGATLVVVPGLLRAQPRAVAALIRRTAVSIWYSVPHAAVRIANAACGARAPLTMLRHVVLAGEPFPGRAIPLLRFAFPSARLHNWYGPTETNVVTAHTVTEKSARPEAPIGRPCPYAALRIVNSVGNVLDGCGQTGNLEISGGSLMLGYWRKAAETEARISLRGSTRWYKTGDLAHRDVDGQYWYDGRADRMVKLEGHRVEPDYIEAVLARGIAGGGVAVIPYYDWTRGRRSLVAFCESPTDIAELGKWARRALPKYMVPSAFVSLSELPRGRRGKVDLESLRRLTPLAHVRRAAPWSIQESTDFLNEISARLSTPQLEVALAGPDMSLPDAVVQELRSHIIFAVRGYANEFVGTS